MPLSDMSDEERQQRRDANFRDLRHGVAIVIVIALACVIALAYLNS